MSSVRGDYRGAAGYHRFCSDVDRSLVRQDLETDTRPSAFSASLLVRKIGAFDLITTNLPPLRSRRSPDQSAGGDVFLLRSRRGSGTLSHVGGIERIEPHRLTVIPADETFSVTYPDHTELTFLTLPAGLVDSRFPSLRRGIRTIELDQLGGRVLAMTLDGGHDASTRTASLHELIQSSLSILVADDRAGAGDVTDQQRALRERALHHIARCERPADNRRSEVANDMFVSLRQLHRAFAGGRTVADTIRQRRLHEASRLLAREAHSITVVTHTVGFASASHLATHFRAEFGMTPSAWRDQARN